MSAREPESIRRLRRENLAGLTGRVLEVGAGTGTNFEFYPADGHGGRRHRARAAPRSARAAGRRQGADTRHGQHRHRRAVRVSATGEPFDAVVCSLVLCSVDDPDAVLRQLFSTLRPGGELRYLEHVASAGPRARMQRLADATVWPRLLGNCHTHRHTEQSIADAGFEVARRPARVGGARVGADARLGDRDRAGRQAGLTPRQPSSAGSRCNRFGQRGGRRFAQRDRRALRQRRAFGVHLDHRDALGQGELGKPGCGIDDGRGAHDDRHVGGGDRVDRTVPRLAGQRLPEPHHFGPDQAAARTPRRFDRLDGLGHGGQFAEVAASGNGRNEIRTGCRAGGRPACCPPARAGRRRSG